MRVERIIQHLENVKETGQGKWQACCPAHEDNSPSLSIRSEADKVLLHCHSGCASVDIVKAMGLTLADLFSTPQNGTASKKTIVAEYDYHDPAGKLLFQAVRFLPKDFRLRKPKPGGGWDWSVKDVDQVPYRLPELLAADPASTVFIVEGEKDVDRLRSLGLIATCNAGGAGKWKPCHAKHLQGRHVVVLPDNDEAGDDHASKVARTLQGIAASVKTVYLPGLPIKGDASDWFDTGGTVEELKGLVDSVDVDTISENVEENDSSVNVNAYQPFSIYCLPKVVAEYVGAASEAIGCDASFIALPMLCSLARAIGNSRVIRLKRTWCEPAIIWASIVGKSGSHKTPALQAALKFIDKRQAKSIAENIEKLADFEQDKAKYDRDLAAWKKSKDTDLAPWPPEQPACTRFVTSDCTIEAFASLLAVQFDGLLVSRDELAGWISGIAEYKNGKGSDLGHWLACWSGAPLTVDRKTGAIKMLHIPRAAVSLIGGIQPGVLRKAIAQEHMQDGLCARLLFAMPTPRKVVWSDAIVDPEIEAAMDQLFDELCSLEPAADEHGESIPYPLDLTPAAKTLWVDYFNRHRAELVDLDDDLAAAWSKLEAYTARFALIFQLCRNPDSEAIDDASIEAAIELSDWFGCEAKRVYGLFSEDEAGRDRRELVEAIQRKDGSVTARDLMRCCRRFKKSKEAEAALQELVEAGIGRWEVVPTTTKQKRVFVLLTALTVTDSPISADSGESVSVNGVSTSPNHLNGQCRGGAV